MAWRQTLNDSEVHLYNLMSLHCLLVSLEFPNRQKILKEEKKTVQNFEPRSKKLCVCGAVR